MAAYAEAFARDRWRIYKCEERLRVVGLGGTAIGTGLGAPRQYIFRVVDQLQRVTGFGLARAENLIDATQNADVFVEVSASSARWRRIFSKSATTCGCWLPAPGGPGRDPSAARQAGSSIMPGKVNPVIPEAVAQAALAISACDHALVAAASLGNLELNQFLPLVADGLLTGLDLARNACRVFEKHCVSGLGANADACRRAVDTATATATALVDRIGYEEAERVAQAAETSASPSRKSLSSGNCSRRNSSRKPFRRRP